MQGHRLEIQLDSKYLRKHIARGITAGCQTPRRGRATYLSYCGVQAHDLTTYSTTTLSPIQSLTFSSIMKFLSHMRSKTRLKHNGDEAQLYHHYVPDSKTTYRRGGPNPTAKIPVQLLSTILSYVCPHSQDDTYTTCEDSMLDGGVCMLCDMRDLAHCALVSRQWAEATQRCL